MRWITTASCQTVMEHPRSRQHALNGVTDAISSSLSTAIIPLVWKLANRHIFRRSYRIPTCERYTKQHLYGPLHGKWWTNVSPNSHLDNYDGFKVQGLLNNYDVIIFVQTSLRSGHSEAFIFRKLLRFTLLYYICIRTVRCRSHSSQSYHQSLREWTPTILPSKSKNWSENKRHGPVII